MNQDDQLERILDQALSEYRLAEPLAGLEERVLQRLRVQTEERRIAWWKWGAVAACAAMLAIAAWLGWREHAVPIDVARQPVESRHTVAPSETKAAPQTSRTVSGSASPRLDRPQATPVRHAGASPPSQQTMQAQMENLNGVSRDHPQGTPLTDDERALMALAQTHPEALRAIAQDDRPITITPLSVQPLPFEANQEGDN